MGEMDSGFQSWFYRQAVRWDRIESRAASEMSSNHNQYEGKGV